MAIFAVIPRPPAAFSPFTMTKSTPRSLRNTGTDFMTALRPGSPTMSPRNRMRIICRFYRNFLAAQCKNSRTLKAAQATIAFLLFAASLNATLSPLAPQPDWSKLDAFQETITRQDFVSLLDQVYAPAGVWKETIAVKDDMAVITTRPDESPFLLALCAIARHGEIDPQVLARARPASR